MHPRISQQPRQRSRNRSQGFNRLDDLPILDEFGESDLNVGIANDSFCSCMPLSELIDQQCAAL